MKAIWKIPFYLFLGNILIYLNCAKVANSHQQKTNLRNGFGQTGNLIGHGAVKGDPNLKKHNGGAFPVQANDNEQAVSGNTQEPEEGAQVPQAPAQSAGGPTSPAEPEDHNSLREVESYEKDKCISSKEEEVLQERELEDDVEKEDAHEGNTEKGEGSDSTNDDDVNLEDGDEEVEDENEDQEYSEQIAETQNPQKMPMAQNKHSDVGHESLITEAIIHSVLAEKYNEIVKDKKAAEAFVNTLLNLLDGDNSAIDDAIKHLAGDISQFVFKSKK
ncbi:hypothetical protein C922_03326 [Plasmodium inui San Antonio 1]|uniref:Merozoite surface protein 3 n=1 Tax=Plasmodium inui San Antonio 1 TaxID=1237626 RepID=W7ALB0_9APIC|nr:hypothetical protein C922_03326 [Plasmodium inui San Antonio 1]EUD66131.1 hypothetical protein C922_03326 [Plasmodium inui San Antonio 1]